MQTHAKKRLEVIIEKPAGRRLRDILDRDQVPGYTILPVLGGSGESGAWSREGEISEASGMLCFVAVMDESKLEILLEDVFALVERHVGIVSVSDTEVVRGAQF